MRMFLTTAGERLPLGCSVPWLAEMIPEGTAGRLGVEARKPSVWVEVESTRHAFDTRGWERLADGVWRRNREVVLENACASGFDLHVRCAPDRAEFTYRWRPPKR